METYIGAVIYIILFVLFCGVMEWRTRVLNSRVNKAIDDLTETNQQIRQVVKDIRK